MNEYLEVGQTAATCGSGALLGAGASWWAISNRFSKQTQELNDLKVHVAENYMTKDEANDGFKEIKNGLKSLHEKVDRILMQK